MEIYQLRTFVAVAREGSITRASERLYLSQPAISAHIKTLEDTLGIALFERTARGMILTSDGQRILVKAEQTLGIHRELIDEAARIKGKPIGKLKLGADSSSDAESIGRFLRDLSELYPDVEIELRQDTSVDLLNDIRNGNLDAGFYQEAGEPDVDLVTIEISRFDIYVVARRGLVASPEAPDWQALAGLPWIFPAANPCCEQATEDLFAVHKFRPRRIISVDSESVIRTLLSGGVGVGLLSGAVAREAQLCGTVDIICEARKSVRTLFAHPAHRVHSPLLSAASSILRHAAHAT